MLQKALGFDISLRHGTLIEATWDLSKDRQGLVEYDIINHWTKGNGLNEQSTLDDLRRKAHTILQSFDGHHVGGVPLGLDYDPTTAFWGRRIQASVLSFFVGYTIRTLELKGIPVVLISPAQVRRRLGLPHTAHKESIWELFNGLKIRKMHDKWLASDLRDALVLSYLTARGNEGQRATTTSRSPRLPGWEDEGANTTST